MMSIITDPGYGNPKLADILKDNGGRKNSFLTLFSIPVDTVLGMLGAAISCLVASVLWTWERAKYHDEEKNFLWTSPGHFTFLKCVYVCSRYCAALMLITHLCIFAVLSTYYPNVPFWYCRGVLAYETVTTYYFMGILNFIMIIRIYALYSQSTLMALFLVLLFAGWVANAVVATIIYLPLNQFTPTCGLVDLNQKGFYIFAFTQLAVQAIFIALTFGRTLSIKRALRGAGAAMRIIAPLLRRLTKDSFIMFIFAAASSVLAIGFSTDKVFIDRVAEVSLPLYILLISTVGCRLILHTRRITPPETPQAHHTLHSLDSTWNVNSDVVDQQEPNNA